MNHANQKPMSNAMRKMLASILLFLAHHPSRGERVTLEYTAQASTVTGQPFGMTVPRLTVVKGYMTYETNTPDLRPADVMRGEFVMLGTWDFRAEFLGKVIRGSGTAASATNLFGSPTLRFDDGDNSPKAGIMSFDGAPDETIGLGFSISGQAKDLPTDQLPVRFTFNPPPEGASHTFVLKNQAGSMLLQFTSFRQIDLKIISIRRIGDQAEITWASSEGKRYGLEFSQDLQNWTRIRSDLIGAALQSTVIDPLATRYPSGIPSKGFYRIIDLPI